MAGNARATRTSTPGLGFNRVLEFQLALGGHDEVIEFAI